MGEINKLSTSLTETVKDGELQKVTLDLTEVLADSFLADGLMRDIPILGTLAGLYKTSKSVHDRLFMKKLMWFLFELKDVPKAQRNKQIEKIEQSSEYRTKVGEKILYIIDKCEDSEKAALVGKLFCAYLEEKISYDDLQRCVISIDRIYLSDLKWFVNSDWTDLHVDDGGSEFLSYGLMELVPIKPKIKVDTSRQRYLGSGDPEYRIEDTALKCEISKIGKIVRMILKE